MDTLIEGYRRFRRNGWARHRELFDSLAQGQSPRAMIIACADSRVDPQLIFDVAPGELFTVRNVANLVPPYAPDAAYHGTSAALEFGVRGLKVPEIIVMGHAQCGGIRALLQDDPGPATDFINPWMQIAAPARTTALAASQDPDARQECCEFEAVKLSLRNLLTFPWIAERVEQGNLRLNGCYFGVATGRLLVLGEDGTFREP